MGKNLLKLALTIYHYGSLNIYYNNALYKTTYPLLPESQVINIFFVIREFVRFCSIRHLYVKVFLLGTNISVCLYNTGLYRLRLV